VIGAVLSGLLDDGSAGLLAVKRCGGLAFIQAPDHATEPEMPSRAAAYLGDALDGSLPAPELGNRIAQLIGSPAPIAAVPEDIQLEMKMLLGQGDGLDILSRQSAPVSTSCPECGGAGTPTPCARCCSRASTSRARATDVAQGGWRAMFERRSLLAAA
jgi:two-component system chemotaxis response regulator CheB